MNYNYHDSQLEALGDVTNDSQLYFQTEKSRNELLPNSGELTLEDYSSVENQFGKENKICPNSNLDSRLDTLNQMLNGEQNYTVDTKANQFVENSHYLFSGINSSVTGQLDSHTRSQQNHVSDHKINNFRKQSSEQQTIQHTQSDQKSLVSLQNLAQVVQNTFKIEHQTNSHGWIKRMYAGENSQNSNQMRSSLEENSQNQSRGDIRCPRPKINQSQADQNEFDERSLQSLQIKNSFKQSAQENSHSGKPPIRLTLRHSSRAPSGHQTSIEQTEVETNEKNIDYQQHPIKLSQFGDSSRRETDFDIEQPRNYEAEHPRNPPTKAFSEKCLSEPYQTDLQVQNSVFTQSSTHLIENNGYQTENDINDSKHVTLAYGGGTENQTQTQNQNPIDQTQESLNRKQSVGHISFTSGQRQFSNWMTGKHQQYLKDLQLNSNFGQSLLQKVRPDQASSRIEIEETMSSRPIVYPQAPYTKPITQENDIRSQSSDILSGLQMQRSKITYLPQDISMEETETRSYAGLSDHRISRHPSDNRIKKQPSAQIQNEKNYRNILNDLSTRTYEKEKEQDQNKYKTQLNMYRSFERQDNYNNRSLMEKQTAPNISNRTSDLQRENSEEPGQDRKAVIRNMVLKNSRNLVTLTSQETNDQAVRLSQLFKKKEQITTKRQAQSTSVEIHSRRPLASSFADQNPDSHFQNLHQTSTGKVNIGVLRKIQQMQVERKSYDQVQFKEQTRQKPEELYMLPVTSLSQSYDKTNPYKYGEINQDYKKTIDQHPTFSPVNTSTQQSFISSVQKSRITRYKQIERDIQNEREEAQRQEEIKQQQEEAYRQERASILRQHYQQQQMEAPKPIQYQQSIQNEFQPENQRYMEQRKEIQPYNSKQSYPEKNIQQTNIHSFANSPGLQKSNFSVGIIAPADHPIINQQRQDTYQIFKGQLQSAESLKDSNFTLGGESEKNIIPYQDFNDIRQPLIKRMGTAMFGEQKLSQEQLNQAMSREVKNRYSIASFEHDFQEEEDSLLQKSSSQFQIIRKPWNSRERNQCNSRERNYSSQNMQNDNFQNTSVQDDFTQNYQMTDQSWEQQSKIEQLKLTEYVQYNKEVQFQKELPGKQYSQERNQRREIPETQYKPSIPQMRESLDKQYSKERKNYQQFSKEQNLRKEVPEIIQNQPISNVRESLDKQQFSNYNRRSDSQGIQNNLSNSFEKFPIRDIYAKRELNSQSQDIRVQDKQHFQQVQTRENNFQIKPIEQPIDQFYEKFIDQDRQTIQQEKEAFIERYEKLMKKQALIKQQAAKFSSWKSDSGNGLENQTSFDNNQRKQLVTSFENNKTIQRLSAERKFDNSLQSMPQTNHKQLIVQSIETNNYYQPDNITQQNTYQSNLKNNEVIRSASPSPVTLTRMQLKSSFGQKAVIQAKNEHPKETSIERIKRLLPPHEVQQLQSENLNTQKFIESFSPEVSFAPQQIHSYLSRVHYKLPDIEAKARVDEVRQEVHKAVTNLNNTLESQELLLQKQMSNNIDYQPVRMRNEKIQQNQYDRDYNNREQKQALKVQSFKSLPEQSQCIDDRNRILSFDKNPLLASTITSFQPPKIMSAVETICYHDQPSKLSNYKQQQNQSENDDRSTQMQIKTVSSHKFEQQEQLFIESSQMAKMRQTVMESQKVAPDVKELIHMQFLQAQMLMDLHKQFMQASALEEGSVEYQTENADFTERSQNQVQDFSEKSQQQVQNQESYESVRNTSQKQLETVNSICKSMRDAEVQADYDFSVHSKSTVSKYFDKQDVKCYQDHLSQYDPRNLSAFHNKTQSNLSQYHQKSQSMQSQKSQQMQSQNSMQTQSQISQKMQSQRIVSQTVCQQKDKQNSSLKHSTQSYGSQHQSGQKSSQLLLNQIEVTVPQDQCPSQLKSQYIPRSIHDNISGNLSQQDLETRQISHASLQFLDNSRNASTLQQPGFILSNRDTQQAILLNESQQRSSKTALKSVCEASVAGLSQISQTKGKTLTLISKIYQMIEKIDKHVAAKEVLDEVRFLDMQKRMFKLARKYKALKEENQILLKSHRGDPESYDSSIRGRIQKKHNFSIHDEENELMLKINEKNKGTLTERILPTHQ